MLFDSNSKKLSVIALLLALSVLLAWLYHFFGHILITDMYEGNSIFLLNGLINSQDVYSLGFYLEKADMFFLKFIFFAAYFCFSAAVILFSPGSGLKVKSLVFLFATAVVLNSQFSSYMSAYVINDDVRQHTWWMRQFRDKQLFNGDLLALYARKIQPWGVLAVYFPLSFIVDPVVLGKILPPVLLGVSAVYFYRIIFHVTGNRCFSVLGAFIYSITPVFSRQMIGAHARAFAFPFMIIFLYYLIKKDYLKSFIFLALQALFYPMAAILSGLTWFFSFIKIRSGSVYFDMCGKKIGYFMLAFIVCGSVLLGKQYLSYVPEVGKPVCRDDVKNKVEFYNERWPLLPTPSISQQLETNMGKGVFLFRALRKKTVIKNLRKLLRDRRLFLMAVFLLVVILVLWRKTLSLPEEIYYLLISGILMYKTADIFFLKLYSPRRYLEYAAPLASVMIFVILIVAVIMSVRKKWIKRFLTVSVFTLVMLNFNISANEALIDMSENRGLYEYLSRVPADSTIAAHPDLADGIPTFSRRSVFVARDMSVPLFDAYWSKVKKRTFDLFDAYYSDNTAEIHDFCSENGIDYIVVDKRHFDRDYITGGVYFEPFNTFVADKVKGRNFFALENIPDRYKVYENGKIFVIKTETLEEI